MNRTDLPLLLLVFVGASLAVVAASDVAPPLYRMVAGSIAAGCAAVVALLRPPSGGTRPPFGGSR